MEHSGATRLAFCITDLDAGGAERALVQLVTRLDRSRWEPKVFCLSRPGELVKPLAEAGVPVDCLGARKRRNLGVIVRLTRSLRRWHPELLQTYLFHANISGRVAGRLAGVKKIVAGIRVAEKRSRWPLWLDRATRSLVDHHVCVSRGVADFSIRNARLPAERVSVIHNGVNVQQFADAPVADLSSLGIPPESRTILFVGRLDAQKEPFLLLAAAKGLIPVHRDLHFLFVGDGPQKPQLESWVEAHGLHSQVHFVGRRNDVASLYKAAECLALPSRWEGLPNVVLEAMAAGLPVVAARVEGTEELIRSHETGLLVEPGSAVELAGGLALMLSDGAQAREMAQEAQMVVSQRFRWDETVSRYDALYRRLLRL